MIVPEPEPGQMFGQGGLIGWIGLIGRDVTGYVGLRTSTSTSASKPPWTRDGVRSGKQRSRSLQ